MAEKGNITSKKKSTTVAPDCFIIMPIADPDGYTKGHFKKVYEDIISVACKDAGFTPIRADEVKQTNLIHLDILKKLIESPMAVCDLSNRNPNVLFELGLRQAFDKPTVLIQECGTPKIFDISPLRYTEYRKELSYREVLADQKSLMEAIVATKEATDNGEGVNSLINLLSLSNPASLKELGENDTSKMLQVVMAEMNDLKNDFRRSIRRIDTRNIEERRGDDQARYEYERVRAEMNEFRHMIENDAPESLVRDIADRMQRRLYEIIDHGSPVFRARSKRMLMEIDIALTEFFKGDK